MKCLKEHFVLFLQLFYESEIISKLKILFFMLLKVDYRK